MPTDDSFEAAWEAVYDVEKGFFDDFKAARRQKQLEVAQQREHNIKTGKNIRRVMMENAPGLPTMKQYRDDLRPEVS